MTDILVFGELRGGKAKKITKELITAADRIAGELGG